MRRDRRDTNPAFSTRKLKLGTFQTNLDSGCVMSDLDGRLDITWPNTVKLAKLADEMEFEALVPVARWAGFGGTTNPQGPGFECYTWAAGISASTHKSGVISTSHVILNHPIMAAKQGAVIDHISNGRFTLNIVCGWNGPEMEMFGVALQGHDERYDCAEEWITIVKRLWTRGRHVRFRGQVLQHQERLPAAEADPVGASRDHECGRLGARAAFRDTSTAISCSPDCARSTSTSTPRTSRPIAPWRARSTAATSRCGASPTSCRARPKRKRAISTITMSIEKGDWDAADNMVNTMGAEINERNYPPEIRRAMAEQFVSSWGGFPLIGTKEQIVDGLDDAVDGSASTACCCHGRATNRACANSAT